MACTRRENGWIRRAPDPPFTRRSFTRCADAAELKAYLEHGNWCLGSAFYLGDLCFIEQTDGAGEWLVIKQNVAFESASCGVMVANGTFDDFVSAYSGGNARAVPNLRTDDAGRLLHPAQGRGLLGRRALACNREEVVQDNLTFIEAEILCMAKMADMPRAAAQQTDASVKTENTRPRSAHQLEFKL